jgi:hypothetical protein
MALVYVGGTTGGGTGASYTVSLSGTLTGGVASSPAQGDIVIVAAGHGATASSAPTCSGNTMGAYTGAHAALYSNDTWDTNFRTFYMIQGATPDTTLTIGRTNNTTYGGATAVHVWRNVDQATPLDVTTTTVSASNQNGSRVDCPAITPTTAGAVIIACGTGMQTTAGSDFTIPSNMGNGHSAFFDGSTSDAGTFIASVFWTSGAFDPNAVTGGTTSTSSSYAGATLALRPAVVVSTLTHTTDSYLSPAPTEVTKTHTTDSALKETKTLSHTTDSYLQAAVSTVTKTHTTDSLLFAAKTSTHTTDSYLYAQSAKTHTTDSYLEAQATQKTVSHTTDSALKATKTATHTTDSALQKTDTAQHTTDSALAKQNTVHHTTDSYIKKTEDVAHSTDSALQKTDEISHTTDSYLVGGALTISHTTDSLLWTAEPPPRTIINIETGEVLQRVSNKYYIAI